MNADIKRGLLENAAVVLPIAILHSWIYRFLTYHSLFPPQTLEPTIVDRAIPFLVWTVWPYAAMIGVCLVAPLSVRQPHVFRITTAAYVISIMILLTFYVLLPTEIERTVRTPEPDSLTWFVYQQFTHGLGDGGCFPSGHIVFPMIGCWALYRDRRRAANIVAGMTAVSSFSILTIKEHVAWDWLSGVLVGVIAITSAEWMVSRRETRPGENTPELDRAEEIPRSSPQGVQADNWHSQGTTRQHSDRLRTRR